MHRLSVRDDHALDRKVQHRTQIGKRTLLVSGRHPYPQRPLAFGHPIAEHERLMLGKPERRFMPPAGIPEWEEASRQLAAGHDLLYLGLQRPLFGPSVGAECTASISPHQSIGAPCLPVAPGLTDVIWKGYCHCRRWSLCESFPNMGRVIRWKKRIEHPPLSARVRTDACHYLLPVSSLLPRGMLKPPYPEARREVDDLHVRRAAFSRGRMMIACTATRADGARRPPPEVRSPQSPLAGGTPQPKVATASVRAPMQGLEAGHSIVWLPAAQHGQVGSTFVGLGVEGILS